MARLLPSRSGESSDSGSNPRVIGLDSEDADDLLAAMSSETARDLLSSLHEAPATPSELADRVDTSLQNAQYHLGNLEDAGAIKVADTVYSEKGREMNVYAPADRPLVVVAGDDDAGGIRTALASLFAGVALLGVIGAVINAVSGRGILGAGPGTTGGNGGGESGGGPSIIQEAAATATPTSTPPPAGGLGLIDPTAPGTLFFVGGLAVLIAGLVVVTLRR